MTLNLNDNLLKTIEANSKLMTSDDLISLQNKVHSILEERERALSAETMTKEQLLNLYNRHGFSPKTGDKFWKILHPGRGHGFYGWQVGQFEHSCHIDITDFIVLYVIEPDGKSGNYVINCSDNWLKGPIII